MTIIRKLDNITLADIRDVLGQNGKKSNDNWLFQCPICQDSSCDNLIVKGNGTYIHCFSCSDNEGGKWVLSEIERKRAEERKRERENVVINERPRFFDKELREQYAEYMWITNEELLGNKELLDLLYEKRGIDKQTVRDCHIGYDDTEEHWVLPILSLKYECIMGFEYRRKNFDKYNNGSKVRREKGYITDICPIWGRGSKKTLYILEGFLDSYCLRQYLRNKGCPDDYAICSCSNGVSSLLNVMNRITFANYNEIKLMLDTDKAGCENTDKIISKYPFIKDVRKFLFDSGCKDFGEWYMGREVCKSI